MTYAPRRYEDDIYPEDDDYLDWPADMLADLDPPEPDPDLQRDLQMEREWVEGALLDQDDMLDDPRPDLMWHPTGGYVDKYMETVYGGGPL